MTHADRMYDWIMKRLAEGRTVVASTYLTRIEISPMHRDFVRLRGEHVEVCLRHSGAGINRPHGTAGSDDERWESITRDEITAA